MPDCAICGSRFATKRCYFCQKHACTSCIVPADVSGSRTTVKCVACERKKVNKISVAAVLRRNKMVFGILGGYWLFAIFPLPFLNFSGYPPEVMASILQPVLIATALMTIPFVFMMIAWQKKSPG
ncbi:MAG: hypothetical protein QXJ74_06915 [Nitrososphaera sp.]|uniref:hypothetical protein n=1 Tax=Nitrososphaera sp. TaxID=1971748 RepID=UPI0017A21E3B|nr:hypothetical protein [Nitrososphaera sp.]NWG37128.1 hypothetical protein [Nitrososphaera sp.]